MTAAAIDIAPIEDPWAKVVIQSNPDKDSYVLTQPHPLEYPGSAWDALNEAAWIAALEEAEKLGYKPIDAEWAPEEVQPDGTIKWWLYRPDDAVSAN